MFQNRQAQNPSKARAIPRIKEANVNMDLVVITNSKNFEEEAFKEEKPLKNKLLDDWRREDHIKRISFKPFNIFKK